MTLLQKLRNAIWAIEEARAIHFIGLQEKPSGQEVFMKDVPANTPFFCTELYFCDEPPHPAGWAEKSSDGWLWWYGSSVDALEDIDQYRSRCRLLARDERLAL